MKKRKGSGKIDVLGKWLDDCKDEAWEGVKEGCHV